MNLSMGVFSLVSFAHTSNTVVESDKSFYIDISSIVSWSTMVQVLASFSLISGALAVILSVNAFFISNKLEFFHVGN